MKSLILPPLSVLYGAVTRTRLSLYRRGTFHSTKLDRPVISVGNITAGGTGKTPLVEWVSRTLAAVGKKVCILTRGYGRDNPDRMIIVSDGQTVFSNPSEAGDEPFLLATKLDGEAASTELARVLNELLANPQRRRELAERAKQLIAVNQGAAERTIKLSCGQIFCVSAARARFRWPSLTAGSRGNRTGTMRGSRSF